MGPRKGDIGAATVMWNASRFSFVGSFTGAAFRASAARDEEIPMKLQIFAASVLALAAAGPALSQLDEDAQSRLVPPLEAEAEADAEIGTVLGTGALPGVGIGTTSTTETTGPRGPGGLQGGIGATGTITPGSTGGAVPGSGQGPAETGIPIDTTPGGPLLPLANEEAPTPQQ